MADIRVEKLPSGKFNLVVKDDQQVEHRVALDGLYANISAEGSTPRSAAITTPTAPGAGYLQAEAASAKTAIDAIRVALTLAGITA